jgi:hypothetical protein
LGPQELGRHGLFGPGHDRTVECGERRNMVTLFQTLRRFEEELRGQPEFTGRLAEG